MNDSHDHPHQPASDKLVLQRIDDRDWLIHDLDIPLDDARHIIACIHATDDDEMEVVWMRPTPLPRVYVTAVDVLDDLRRWISSGRRDKRPVPIPHFAPARSRTP